jgi:hypothetical protein
MRRMTVPLPSQPRAGRVRQYGDTWHRAESARDSVRPRLPSRVPETLDALAALTASVPEKGRQIVRYYGTDGIIPGGSHSSQGYPARLLYRLKRRWRNGTTHVVYNSLLGFSIASACPPERRRSRMRGRTIRLTSSSSEGADVVLASVHQGEVCPAFRVRRRDMGFGTRNCRR